MTQKVAWWMVVALAGCAAVGAGCKREAPAPPTTAPATRASTEPATRAVVADYVEIVRAAHPQVPATQPLVVPVDLRDAGHYRLNTPVHLDLRSDLWFTHPDAPPLEQTIRDPKVDEQQVHIVPREVVFAVWAPGDKRHWFPRVVVQDQPGARPSAATEPARAPATTRSTAADGSATDKSSAEGAAADGSAREGPLAGARAAGEPAMTGPAAAPGSTSGPSGSPTGGKFAWYWGNERHELQVGRHYRWREAILLNDDSVVVPSERGVSVFRFVPQYNENYHEIVASAAGDANPPQLLLDGRGLLVWSPWDGKRPGGNGAARLVEGQWTQLGPSDQWPARIVHLVPLLDGSVLQITREDDASGGGVKLALAALDVPAVDEQAIGALVEQLSSDDAKQRDQAHAQLTRYGTASWPVLEKLMQDQPPEARIRIANLLRDRIQPTLGGRTPLGGRIDVVSRLEGGGIVLHLPSGVSIPREDNPAAPPIVVQPAWISIRPGHAIELLEPALIKDADPAKHRFFAFGDEWLISDAAKGPHRLYGNHLEPMLRKPESAFAHVVGYDRRGRWLFRRSVDDTGETLLLDPTLPDPTPKLPVWQMAILKGKVGWNVEDYPAINRGGGGHSWVLIEKGWKSLDESNDRLITAKDPHDKSIAAVARGAVGVGGVGAGMPGVRQNATTQRSATQPATTRSTTRPIARLTPTTMAATTRAATASTATTASTTAPATTQSAYGPPILTDADGRTYHDGRESITVVEPSGAVTVWPLPAKAAGESDFDVVLVQTRDGALFLFNASGRVVRIRPTPGQAEPFVVEAVFTHRIPTPETIHRIWLDPAGRIVMAYDQFKLAVMFPGGRIPREIVILIPAGELGDEEDQAAKPAPAAP